MDCFGFAVNKEFNNVMGFCEGFKYVFYEFSVKLKVFTDFDEDEELPEV